LKIVWVGNLILTGENMKVLTGKQMKDIENFAFEKLGFKSDDLMLLAAAGIFVEVLKKIDSLEKKNDEARIVILCGRGNNGQDGIVLSSMLNEKGVSTKVYSILEMEKLNKPEILSNIKEDIKNADIVIDGIFGTGLSREVSGLPLLLIEIINNYSRYTISIDIPSGISSENGEILGQAVFANHTISFQCPKLGCMLFPGVEHVGKLTIHDIGLPEDIINEMSGDYYFIEQSMIKSVLNKRKKNSHKGNYGKVLVVAGSKGMAGAAALCAKAALRAGAGLVKISCNEDILSIVQTLTPESTCISRDETLKVCDEFDSIVIGPGLGINEESQKLLFQILDKYKGKLIIDADALTLVKDNTEKLKKSKADIIITPHEGEAGRLLDVDYKEINLDRIKACKDLVHATSATVILKGSITLVGTQDGKIYFNSTGNPGMATAGSGDVLSGIIASFAAQGMQWDKTAQASVFIHGLAGDAVASKVGEYGLISSDLPLAVGISIRDLISD
jgi:NAD(P)H-hydrate epimerase